MIILPAVGASNADMCSVMVLTERDTATGTRAPVQRTSTWTNRRAAATLFVEGLVSRITMVIL